MYQKYNYKLLEETALHCQCGLQYGTVQSNPKRSFTHHIQPVLHGEKVLVCVRRTDISKNEADDFIFTSYDEAKTEWTDVQ